jgi:hypothetical protein
MVQAQGFDDLPAEQLKRLFLEARSCDHQKLVHEAKKLLALPPREDASGTTVMGDLVLTEDEVEPAMRKLQEGGIHEFCKKLWAEQFSPERSSLHCANSRLRLK